MAGEATAAPPVANDSKHADEKRPEWMTSISSIVNPDDYLLGRKIDKTFELSQKEKADRAKQARIELLAQDKIKLRQDPILQLEKRKRELKLELIRNPVLLKQFRDRLLKGQGASQSRSLGRPHYSIVEGSRKELVKNSIHDDDPKRDSSHRSAREERSECASAKHKESSSHRHDTNSRSDPNTMHNRDKYNHRRHSSDQDESHSPRQRKDCHKSPLKYHDRRTHQNDERPQKSSHRDDRNRKGRARSRERIDKSPLERHRNRRSPSREHRRRSRSHSPRHHKRSPRHRS